MNDSQKCKGNIMADDDKSAVAFQIAPYENLPTNCSEITVLKLTTLFSQCLKSKLTSIAKKMTTTVDENLRPPFHFENNAT